MKQLRTEKDLNRYYEECRQIMLSLGFDAKPIPIKLNGRLSTTLGRYFRGTKRIEINKKYFLYAEEELVRNTIIHEICHQVSKTGGHGEEWKRIASFVSRKTEYKITRLKDLQGSRYIDVTKKTASKKHGVKCTMCNHEWKYATKTKAYKNPQSYSCPYCKVRHTLISVDY